MVNVQIENEVTPLREELADWLGDLADALREDGSAQLPLAGASLTLALSDEMHVEIEVDIDGDDVGLELELSWSTSKDRVPEARDATEDSENAGGAEDDADASERGDDAGRREAQKEGAESGSAQRASGRTSATDGVNPTRPRS